MDLVKFASGNLGGFFCILGCRFPPAADCLRQAAVELVKALAVVPEGSEQVAG